MSKRLGTRGPKASVETLEQLEELIDCFRTDGFELEVYPDLERPGCCAVDVRHGNKEQSVYIFLPEHSLRAKARVRDACRAVLIAAMSHIPGFRERYSM